MIGKLSKSGETVAMLNDEGVWLSEDSDLAEILNATESPNANRRVGDTQRPFGVASLYRAGILFDYDVKVTFEEPPLPPGSVS